MYSKNTWKQTDKTRFFSAGFGAFVSRSWQQHKDMNFYSQRHFFVQESPLTSEGQRLKFSNFHILKDAKSVFCIWLVILWGSSGQPGWATAMLRPGIIGWSKPRSPTRNTECQAGRPRTIWNTFVWRRSGIKLTTHPFSVSHYLSDTGVNIMLWWSYCYCMLCMTVWL